MYLLLETVSSVKWLVVNHLIYNHMICMFHHGAGNRQWPLKQSRYCRNQLNWLFEVYHKMMLQSYWDACVLLLWPPLISESLQYQILYTVCDAFRFIVSLYFNTSLQIRKAFLSLGSRCLGYFWQWQSWRHCTQSLGLGDLGVTCRNLFKMSPDNFFSKCPWGVSTQVSLPETVRQTTYPNYLLWYLNT